MGNTVSRLKEFKMVCNDVEKLASDFTDGNLSEISELALKRHKSDCSDCNQMLNELSQLTNWANELGDLPLSSGVSNRLKAVLFQVSCSEDKPLVFVGGVC